MSIFTFTARETVVVARSIEDVFAFIADAENDPLWCPSVKVIEQIEGDGPGEGAQYRMRHEPGGMEFDATVEFVKLERPRRLQWVMRDSGHELHGTYEIESVDGGTRLSQTSRITFAGWLRIPGLIMKYFIKKDVQKELSTQFANLKEILEAETAVTSEHRKAV